MGKIYGCFWCSYANTCVEICTMHCALLCSIDRGCPNNHKGDKIVNYYHKGINYDIDITDLFSHVALRHFFLSWRWVGLFFQKFNTKTSFNAIQQSYRVHKNVSFTYIRTKYNFSKIGMLWQTNEVLGITFWKCVFLVQINEEKHLLTSWE